MFSELKNKAVEYVNEHKKGLLIFLFVVLVGFMTMRGLFQYPTLEKQQKEIAGLNKQIEYETERQKEVEALQDKVGSDEYISKIATERLGLIPSNAKVFVDVSADQ